MAKRHYLLVLPLMAFFGLLPRGARAYGVDVHFNLTFVLCKIGGFSLNEALIIADADQSLDENPSTTAYDGTVSGAIAHVWNPKNSYLWHSLGDNKASVTNRLNELKGIAQSAITSHRGLDKKDIRERNDGESPQQMKELVKFGQYLHYLQDYYAHRVPDYSNLEKTPVDEENWKPYGTRTGHFFDSHLPDLIPWRKNLAKRMAWVCFEEIVAFTKNILGRPPYVSTHQPKYINISHKTTDALVEALISAYIPSASRKPLAQRPTQAEERASAKRGSPPPVEDPWREGDQTNQQYNGVCDMLDKTIAKLEIEIDLNGGEHANPATLLVQIYHVVPRGAIYSMVFNEKGEWMNSDLILKDLLH